MTKVIIELGDVYRYEKPKIEDEVIFSAGHVILCQIANTQLLNVFGLMLKTSGLTTPYEILHTIINFVIGLLIFIAICHFLANFSARGKRYMQHFY